MVGSKEFEPAFLFGGGGGGKSIQNLTISSIIFSTDPSGRWFQDMMKMVARPRLLVLRTKRGRFRLMKGAGHGE